MLQNCYERTACSCVQHPVRNTVEIHTTKSIRKCVVLQAGNTLTEAETLVRETPKYYYTVESCIMKKPQYFIQLQSYWTSYNYYKAGGQDCHAYNTYEEAKNAIHLTAICWNWDEAHCQIIEKDYNEIIIKHHRYKKG